MHAVDLRSQVLFISLTEAEWDLLEDIEAVCSPPAEFLSFWKFSQRALPRLIFEYGDRGSTNTSRRNSMNVWIVLSTGQQAKPIRLKIARRRVGAPPHLIPLCVFPISPLNLNCGFVRSNIIPTMWSTTIQIYISPCAVIKQLRDTGNI